MSVLQLALQVLERGKVYELFQIAIGGERGRAWFVREHLRPFSGMRVLDIGCGPADIRGHLPSDIYYEGIDAHAPYIERARVRFPKDAFRLIPVEEMAHTEFEGFDLVLAMGVLHHLNDASAAALFAVAANALKPGGRLVTLDPCFVARQNPLAAALAAMDRGDQVRDRGSYERLVNRDDLVVTTSIHHGLLRIPYTHIVMECVRQAAAASNTARVAAGR